MRGSAGYVAIEKASGTLAAGRKGTSILQHYGIMDCETPHLTISVVPDSGTDELIGLVGTMTIDKAARQHSYQSRYTHERLCARPG